jgi:hypothetical protein
VCEGREQGKKKQTTKVVVVVKVERPKRRKTTKFHLTAGGILGALRESLVHTIVSTDYGLCLLVFSLCVCVGKWRQDFLLWVLDPNWIQPASIDHVVVVVASLFFFFFSPAIQTNSHSDDRSRSSTRHAIGETCSGLYVCGSGLHLQGRMCCLPARNCWMHSQIFFFFFDLFLLIPTRPYKEMEEEEDKELLHHSFL